MKKLFKLIVSCTIIFCMLSSCASTENENKVDSAVNNYELRIASDSTLKLSIDGEIKDVWSFSVSDQQLKLYSSDGNLVDQTTIKVQQLSTTQKKGHGIRLENVRTTVVPEHLIPPKVRDDHYIRHIDVKKYQEKHPEGVYVNEGLK